MDFQLTEHARDALKKRNIPLEWVERVFRAPQWIEKDQIDNHLEHRLGRISEFEERVLRVIVNIKTIPMRIITVYFDRRRKDR
jgi:uncharacterized DUF497 family protein